MLSIYHSNEEIFVTHQGLDDFFAQAKYKVLRVLQEGNDSPLVRRNLTQSLFDGHWHGRRSGVGVVVVLRKRKPCVNKFNN